MKTGERSFECVAKQQYSLTVHKRVHKGEKPFKCDKCDYKARDRRTLTTHISLHTDKRPFECDQCVYKAKSRENLKTHKIIHTVQNPFECELCEYKTKMRYSLKIHQRIHTGEKPFKCDQCDYKATEKNKLFLDVIKVSPKLNISWDIKYNPIWAHKYHSVPIDEESSKLTLHTLNHLFPPPVLMMTLLNRKCQEMYLQWI